MTQPTIPTALNRPPAVAPNAPTPKSECADATRERGQASEFFFDRDYVRRLTEGDAETEAHFVRCFSPLLRIKLKQRLRSSEPLEDLRQQVFLRVLRSLRQGSGPQDPECLGARVLSTCNQVVQEILRGQGKPESWNERTPPLNEDHSCQMRSLIEGMTARDRSLIRAIFLEERHQDAVCREQGVGRDYLRMLLHLTRKRFRQLLADAQAAPPTR